MRLSLSFLRPAAGLDLATGAFVAGGVVLIAGALVAAMSLGAPTPASEPAPTEAEASPTTAAPTAATRPPAGLAADQVATVLFVDASTGAGSAARSGDHVDVLGYFARAIIGSESVTRLLLQDTSVLTVDRGGPNNTVALTLAVAPDAALLLQEAQAIGARPFVTLRSIGLTPPAQGVPLSYSDTDLAHRLAGVR